MVFVFEAVFFFGHSLFFLLSFSSPPYCTRSGAALQHKKAQFVTSYRRLSLVIKNPFQCLYVASQADLNQRQRCVDLDLCRWGLITIVTLDFRYFLSYFFLALHLVSP